MPLWRVKGHNTAAATTTTTTTTTTNTTTIVDAKCELLWPLEVDTWEAGEDRKAIAQREREHNPFLVLYDVKQLGSGCRIIASEDSCG
jgi:hypothetical protein